MARCSRCQGQIETGLELELHGEGLCPIYAPYDNDAARTQAYWRQRAKADTERFGFKEGELQWLWRIPECFGRKYNSGEVVAAICDALTREGQTAWPGDGTSCVEQMIRLQWDRAEKAEAELAASSKENARLRHEASTDAEAMRLGLIELSKLRASLPTPEEAASLVSWIEAAQEVSGWKLITIEKNAVAKLRSSSL